MGFGAMDVHTSSRVFGAQSDRADQGIPAAATATAIESPEPNRGSWVMSLDANHETSEIPAQHWATRLLSDLTSAVEPLSRAIGRMMGDALKRSPRQGEFSSFSATLERAFEPLARASE